MSPPPVVGCSVGLNEFGDYAAVGFQRPLSLVGAVALNLTRVPGTIDAQLDLVDAVVIGGGRDIEPWRYGQEPVVELTPPDPLRDEFEFELVRRTIERGIPLIGMCRGCQIVNVALGGTLVQDLSLVAEWADHPIDVGWARWRVLEAASLRDEREVPEHPRHALVVEPGSRLHQALGTTEVAVGTFHHQAIDRLGAGLRITGRAPDGVVEAIELADPDRYVVGTQFELQEDWRSEPRFLELFRALLRHAGSAAA